MSDFATLFTFLDGLTANNSKEWMDANRPTYKSLRQFFIGWLDEMNVVLARHRPDGARSAVEPRIARRIEAVRHRRDPITRPRRVESRRHDHREDELVPAVHVRQRVEVRQLNVDPVAGFDVGDLLREDVRALLRQQ